jgi:CBS domain containing-hemolysin-like protein
MSPLLQLLSVPLLIALNAFFVAAEYAIVAARANHIEALRSRGRPRAAAALEALKDEPTATIGAVQVCITMTNLLLGWLGEPAMDALLEKALGPLVALYPQLFRIISLVLSFLVVTLLTVVFSELLPKALTLRYVLPAAALTAVPMLFIRRGVRPLVGVMNALANLITVPMGLGRVQDFEEQQITPEEIRTMAQQAAADGTVTAQETAMILNALSIGRRRAREIMTPRNHVAALDLQKSMDANRAVLNERLHSHLPLCDGGLDNVAGFIETKEFLSAYNAAGDTSVLSLLAQPPVYVPETVGLDRLLATFQESRAPMLFVVDEYGGVEGVVTLRDVLDELLTPSPPPQPAAVPPV